MTLDEIYQEHRLDYQIQAQVYPFFHLCSCVRLMTPYFKTQKSLKMKCDSKNKEETEKKTKKQSLGNFFVHKTENKQNHSAQISETICQNLAIVIQPNHL